MDDATFCIIIIAILGVLVIIDMKKAARKGGFKWRLW